MNNIKLIACDTDGVILEDTFSPILHKMSKILHIPYTEEMERNTFSRDDGEALKYIQEKLNVSNNKISSIYHMYFKERNKYIQASGRNPILSGAYNLLRRLKNSNAKVICYGGLKYSQVDNRAKPLLSKFDKYICTGSFRPGIKEITKDIYHLPYSKILFIDDVNTVAETAKKHNVPFIGVPTDYSWGYQKQDMKKTGVKYLANSINDITNNYLNRIDSDKHIWY